MSTTICRQGARRANPSDAAEAIVSDLEPATHLELNTRSEYAARIAILLNKGADIYLRANAEPYLLLMEIQTQPISEHSKISLRSLDVMMNS
jgi:hypothetical protein